MIGIKIKKAGIFIKPILKGKLASKNVPDIRKPNAPINIDFDSVEIEIEKDVRTK